MASFLKEFLPKGKNFYRAEQTLALIEKALTYDQGNSYREWLGRVLPHIGDAYRVNKERFRRHLGASGLGDECARKVWYNFRWYTNKKLDGRMIRLFNRGHLEEGRFIAMLLTAGIQVYQQDENGNQYRIAFSNGHGGGSGDGIAFGVPEVPNAAVLLEFKTASDKKWNEFNGNGVEVANPTYFVQMQLYLEKMNICAALFMVINKNDDQLHAEIVMRREGFTNPFLALADDIVYADPQNKPKKLNQSPGFFKCRYCDHREVCHLGGVPDVNCRTCVHSAPVEGGIWECRLDNMPVNLSMETQLRGCENYERIIEKD